MKSLFYTDKYSYDIDDMVNIFLFSTNNNIDIKIYNISREVIYYNKIKLDISKLNIEEHSELFKENNIPFYNGYGFKKSLDINIKDTKLEKGLYFIEINQFYRPIIILNKNRSNTNLILMNTNTWEAYNTDGGGSFYIYNLQFDTEGIGKYDKTKEKNKPTYGKVNFNRTNKAISDEISIYIKNGIEKYKSHLIYGELYLLSFLVSNSIDFDLFCDRDAHNNYPVWNYNRVILNTHPEYWSNSQINNIKKSNNILSFAGNVGYRVVEYNQEQNIIMNNRSKKGMVKSDYLKHITGCLFDVKCGKSQKYNIIDKDHPIFKNITSDEFGCLKTKFRDLFKGDDVYLEGTSGWETDKQIDKKFGKIIAVGETGSKGADVLVYEYINRILISFNSILFCHGIYFDGGNTKKIVLNCLNVFNSVCKCCGSCQYTYAKFGNGTRCKKCSALDRHEYLVEMYMNSDINLTNKTILIVGDGNKQHIPLFFKKIGKVTTGNILKSKQYDIQIDLQNLVNIRDNSYDSVIMQHVLSAIENDTQAVSEIYRILKNGGVLILNDKIVPETIIYNNNTLPRRLYSLKDMRKLLNKYFKVNIIAHGPYHFFICYKL